MADQNSANVIPNSAPANEGPPNSGTAQEDGTDTITADEIALYDRQIRLWGVQAQENIRQANVLLIRVKALANEIAKNLVLAGINSLTIIDHEAVTENDLGAQFFLTAADVGKNVSFSARPREFKVLMYFQRAEAAAPRIRELNPRVAVNVDTSDVSTKDQSFMEPFTIVIATDLPYPVLSVLNAATRLANRKFYAAGVHGFYGYVFADLIKHQYIIERAKSTVPTRLGHETYTRTIVDSKTKREEGRVTETVTKEEVYHPLVLANSSPLPTSIRNVRRRVKQVTPLLSCLRALWEFEKQFGRLPHRTNHDDIRKFTELATNCHKELSLPSDTLKADFLRSFLQNMGSELPPTTAIIGGLVAQDVINVIGQREQPIQNLALFDGEGYRVPVFALYPEFDEEREKAVANGGTDVGVPTAMIL
jgi:ubiquitin-like 1-activating enzyme E1 A